MKNERKSVLVGAVVVGFMIGALSLPGDLRSGDLEPTAPPGPTMKTLDEIPPTWSQKIDGPARFELVLDGDAVLDKETGLVWERSPDASLSSWVAASDHCYPRQVGGRFGWRLPTVEELSSLLDWTQWAPCLPAGHPFLNVSTSYFWTSSTQQSQADSVWGVCLYAGGVNGISKTGGFCCWCVRGGQGHDAY